MRRLTHFDIAVRDEDFLMRLEADGGETLEFAVDPERMEQMIHRLNDLLGSDDEDEEAAFSETPSESLG